MALSFALGLVMGLARMKEAQASDPALRIRNGHKMRVVLGRAHEIALGIRPENKVWTLKLTADIVGAAAEFEDVTPAWQPVRRNIPIKTDSMVLDAPNFVADHVYRVEVRRATQLVGSALVYLYPLPVERVHRLHFESTPKPSDRRGRTAAPAVSPKPGL